MREDERYRLGKSVKDSAASYAFDRHYSATLDPNAKAGQFKFLKDLGEGSYGKVSLVEHNETGEQLAMKDVEVIDCDWDKLDRELKIMLAADSPNLSSKFLAKVRYYYWVKPKIVEKCFAHIAMEYFPPRDLGYMLNYTCDLFTRPQALKFIAANMIVAIEYIHSLGIIHRDIKPENFLVNFPDGYLRMTDFGISNIQSQASLFKGIGGTPEYIAPEIYLDKKRYTEKDSSVAVAPLVVNGKAVAGAGSGISNADKPKKVEKCFAHIAMEYFAPRDLLYMLNYTCDLYKRPQALQFIAANMVMAIEYIHSLGIIHRDIKPANFLMTDFGISNIQSQASLFKGIHGTLSYIAPEIFLNNGKKYTKAADWWSLGVTLYYMAKCRSLFYGYGVQEIGYSIITERIVMPSYFPPMFADLVKSLLNRDPKVRLGANGASDVKAHQFFSGFDWKKLQTQEMDTPIVPKYDAKGDLYYRDTVANEDLNLR